jgi:CheY-like chemotaxis protein
MDDERLLRESVCVLLEEMGYEATGVSDGKEVLETYGKAMEAGQPYDVVILDLTVRSGMGGARALEQLKSNYPDVKAIVSSGYSNKPVMADYESHGFDGVLVKPYSPSTLQQEIQRVLAPSG